MCNGEEQSVKVSVNSSINQTHADGDRQQMHLKTAGLTPTPSGAQWSPESVAVGAFPHAAAVHGWNTEHGFHASSDPDWRDSSLSPTREFIFTSIGDPDG